MTFAATRLINEVMSDAQRRLWRALRVRHLDGARFRRQHPIGRYIADFVCLERRLVVEVDGEQYGDEKQIVHDALRPLARRRLPRHARFHSGGAPEYRGRAQLHTFGPRGQASSFIMYVYGA